MANDIVDHRAETYGEPVDQYRRIAQMWSGLIGHEVQPFEAALMMACVKMVRAQRTPDYSDNTDDIDGYVEIARKIVGPDMIHARTVEEYLEKKYPPRRVDMGVHPHLLDNAATGITKMPDVFNLHEERMRRQAEELELPNGDGDIG